jgi:hypothetical protein
MHGQDESLPTGPETPAVVAAAQQYVAEHAGGTGYRVLLDGDRPEGVLSALAQVDGLISAGLQARIGESALSDRELADEVTQRLTVTLGLRAETPEVRALRAMSTLAARTAYQLLATADKVTVHRVVEHGEVIAVDIHGPGEQK